MLQSTLLRSQCIWRKGKLCVKSTSLLRAISRCCSSHQLLMSPQCATVGFFKAPLPQLCRILRLLDLSVCGRVTGLSSLLDAAEIIAKIISRAQHKKSCSWCTLAQPSCKVGAGHPALRSHRWPQLQGCGISFFSQQSFPFEECCLSVWNTNEAGKMHYSNGELQRKSCYLEDSAGPFRFS